ncbi:uncharacterized protein [Phaseolus vulgaris]|uniref:uncharacterized protein n=1 Tax=Phaseolus vulgaris TaxID=3885 RepID=UPI0035C9696A
MGSTTNNNNDTATEEHRTILQTLQIQMQELLQKGVIDQLRQDEKKKRQEEERQRHAEEMAQLKEQNKRLMERLEQSEREGHSRAPSPPPLQSGTKTIAQTIAQTMPPTSLVQHTHQSVKQVTPNRVANPRGHPFTDDIIATPLPDKWRGLTINLYDGSTDPDEHLNIFRTQMTLYTTDRTVWCKVFPTSLREGPLGWFSDLPPNSITSFDALELKFTTQYATSRPHRTSSMSLLNVKQEKGESLRTFMDRFSKVCMSIRNLNPEIAMHHLVSAILPGRFTESLIKRPPCNMDELRTRVTKFMQIEEHIDYHRKTHVENTDRGKGIRPPIVPTNRDRHRPNRGPRFHNYTPLIVPRGKVLDEALQIELIPALKQSQTPPNADTSKRCQYHRNYGHTTEGCQALKDKIEELVQAGHLRKFVKTTLTVSRSPQRDHDPRECAGRRDDRTRDNHYLLNRRKRSESPPPQEINYIAGGFAGGGCSNSARKKHLRAVQFVHSTSTQRRPHIPPITFTDEDFTAIDPSQDDPMVITVEIDKFAIAKVLVDQGSSVDILYWETFKKMKIPEAEIQPYNEQIVGFSGERVDTKGFIDLYTTIGDDYLSKTINIRYLLVNANTSYNILLGHPSINRLKAIVSTPHLAMKFPSVNGDIATVHVDQKIARECYVASLKVEPTRSDVIPLAI